MAVLAAKMRAGSQRAWLLLALSGALAEDGHRIVNLLASTAVRGAAFPTDQWGAECDTETLNSTPCSCYGGAARRRTFLSAGRQDADTVTLDLTSYFFGNGLFATAALPAGSRAPRFHAPPVPFPCCFAPPVLA